MAEHAKSNKMAECKDSQYLGIAVSFPWLPSYTIKLGEGRIEGGEKLKACIKSENLHLLEVPEQSLYRIPASHHSLSHLRTLCICRYIEGKQGRELLISKLHVQQLRILIKRTGLGDMKWRNLVHTPHNTIALIDTEIETFWGAQYGLAMLREWNTLEEDSRRERYRLLFPGSMESVETL
jgi:hypothetical protein